jgi:hypothetical protein
VIKAVCSALHDPVSCLSPWRHGNTGFFFCEGACAPPSSPHPATDTD